MKIDLQIWDFYHKTRTKNYFWFCKFFSKSADGLCWEISGKKIFKKMLRQKFNRISCSKCFKNHWFEFFFKFNDVWPLKLSFIKICFYSAVCSLSSKNLRVKLFMNKFFNCVNSLRMCRVMVIASTLHVRVLWFEFCRRNTFLSLIFCAHYSYWKVYFSILNTAIYWL